MISRLRTLAAPLVLALTGLVPVAAAQQSPTPPVHAVSKTPWLYKGSDVPQDPAWHFGVLPNGVRYAVRRNGVPPHQVAIRVRMDAGSLMETDSERGYAHLIEHLSFRGSEHVPDGESKRIWQRLGATFGSDTNANTTFTQTVYKLDLPDATQAGLDESMKILAGMMAHPTLTQAALDAERPVVLAEQREQPGAQVRFNDSLLGLVFAGQPLANRNPIGTVATLTAATPATVQAFHDRWYRPERAVVVVVGDMPVELLEKMVVDHFSDWRGIGPATPTPDFGKPANIPPHAISFVEPTLPLAVLSAVVRPWTVFQDTVLFNQKRMIDMVALRIIDRRLETRARAGGSFLAASADLQDISRSANVTLMMIRPSGDDWPKALHDVRAVVADAMAKPPTQAEIDRELAEIDTAMRNSVATAQVEAGADLADTLVEAVDINETTTSAAASYGIFKQAVDHKMFTPAAVQASTRRVFQGVVTRAMVSLPTPDPEAVDKLTTALNEPVSGEAGVRKAVRAVSFDQLPPLGKPGTVVSRSVLLNEPKIELVKFANGVNLQLFATSSEHNRVYVRVQFGAGLAALPANRRVPAWAADLALMASGIGSFGQEELDALTGKHQIGMDFDIGNDSFVLSGQTNPTDLPDQLKLFAEKLAHPRWDPNPVNRARAVMLAGYDSTTASPDAVLSRELEHLLHSGDPRWGMPSRAEITALTPAAFRTLWQPLLASGPIEVQVYGDINIDKAIAAVAQTFGALPPRPAQARLTPPAAFPAHDAQPVVLTHKGQPDQAAAIIAWPTGGGSANAREARQLDVLAAIFHDRLIDQLRSQAGVSYSPNVTSDWPMDAASGGKILAIGLVPPNKVDFFFTLARGIAADLVAKPVDRDELRRSLVPLAQLLLRRSTGSPFWMLSMAGGSTDPGRVAATRTMAQDVGSTTPADIQALARKYLRPDRDWTLEVLPEAKAK